MFKYDMAQDDGLYELHSPNDSMVMVAKTPAEEQQILEKAEEDFEKKKNLENVEENKAKQSLVH